MQPSSSNHHRKFIIFFIIYQTFPMVFNEFILFSNTILIHLRLLNSRKQEFWVEIRVVT